MSLTFNESVNVFDLVEISRVRLFVSESAINDGVFPTTEEVIEKLNTKSDKRFITATILQVKSDLLIAGWEIEHII